MAFKKVENNQKYLRAVIFGESGTGKTTLAEKLAIGLCKKENKNKVYILDTEGGIEFFADHLEEEGIECFQSDVKFDTYEKFTNELSAILKENPPVLVIDSITSIGELLQKQYVTIGKQSYQQWGMAKEVHKQKVINLLQNAPFHVIVCGRETKGEGDLTDIKMRLGIDIEYELNLLIRTTREMEGENQIRVAHILKDRTTKIDGKKFKNAKFDDFKPLVDALSKKIDTEIYKELKSKLLSCNDSEYLTLLTDALSEAVKERQITDIETQELRALWVNTKKKLPEFVAVENILSNLNDNKKYEKIRI